MNRNIIVIFVSAILEGIIIIVGSMNEVPMPLLITGVILLVVVQIVSFVQTQKQSVSKSVVEALSQIKNEISGSLGKREARIYPGDSLPNLRVIDNVINQIKMKNHVEVLVQNMGAGYLKNEPLEVHQVFPGMSQRFLILIGGKITDGTNLYYLRIYPPDSKITDRIDERDFAETWFNNIFPVLGNYSGEISEKTLGYTQNGWEFDAECFIISKYKYIKTKKANKLDRLRIYID